MESGTAKFEKVIKRVFIAVQISCLIVFGHGSMAQESWSLDSCVSYALKNNIQVKQSELNVRRAEYGLSQSKANLLPNLNGDASNSYNIGKRIDPFTNTFASETVRSNNFSLSSGINLFDGFANYNSIKKSKYDLLASQYNTDVIKNNISLSIAANFLQILLNMELVNVASAQLQQTKIQLERLSKLVLAGIATKSDLLDIESQYALEELNVINANNNLDLSYLDLTQLLDLDGKVNFSIRKPDIPDISDDVLDLSPEMIYNKALANYPTIKMSEQSLLSNEMALKIARAGHIPSISFSASIGTGYSGASQELVGTEPGTISAIGITETTLENVYELYATPVGIYQDKSFRIQFKDNVYEYIGLSLSVPIFTRFSIKNSVNYAKLNVQTQQYALELEKNNLRKTITQAHANAQAAMKRYKASKIAVDALSESFRNITKKYDQNIIEFVEYSSSKTNLNRTESDLLQAKFDYLFKVKILDFYQGRPLKF
ncbi:MAG: TolC family protein [Bacteroidetes bacterium]|nr:TolC family protein [Bacteroidota bacterium]